MAKKKKAHPDRDRTADRELRDALDQAHSLMARRRWGAARALLDSLLGRHPQDPGVLRALVEVAVHLDDTHTYLYACERLHAVEPHDRHLPYMLTTAYLKNGWLSLAWFMGQRALAQDPANEKARETRKLLAELEPAIAAEINRLGLDGADGLECLTLHDRVRSLLAQGRYARAHEAAEQLIQRRPRFAPAYNNGAEAYYHDGQLAQAVRFQQRLLQFEPNNVFALANLVRFFCVWGKNEEARGYAQRLTAIKPEVKDLAVKQAEALAWLGDDAGVLAVFEQGRNLVGMREGHDDALLDHLAAVAAYRLGREEEARGYWQSALRAVPHFEPARQNLDDLRLPIGQRNAPWSYRFTNFVPKKLVSGLKAQLAPVRGKNADAALQREANRYLADHPELEGLIPLLLDRSDGPGRELAVNLAGLFQTPGMLQAVRDFALGQRGPDQLRLQASRLAEEAGLLPPGPRRLWLEGAWHDTKTQRFEIHSDPVERTHASGVFDLLTRGMAAFRGGDAAGAERLLRQALALDPDDPVVLNNLAAACAQLGREEESEALSIRLHERHPDYLFGRTALANLACQRGQVERARALLQPLQERPRLHIGEFTALCIAEINLYFATGQRNQVEHWLGMLRQVVPDHPLLESFERRLQSMPR